METKDTLQIVKVLTFFVIMMFLNYVFGNLFDLKVVQYFNENYKSFFNGDVQSMKLISLLFFGLYVFIYSTIVTWMLGRFFSVGKGFILSHLNSVILLLLLSGVSWMNGISITYPGNYLDALPIISVAVLVVSGMLSGKIAFFDPNADDSSGLFDSIRKDVSGANGEVKGFFASIKSSFERSKDEEDTRFDNFGNETAVVEPNLRDKFKGGIDFDNSDFGSRPQGDRMGVGIGMGIPRPPVDSGDEYIDLPDTQDKKDDEFDIRPKDIKGLLRENRDRISNPLSDMGGVDSRKNPFDEISDINELPDDSIRVDESDMPNNDDGYIEITEQEEDDNEIPMDNFEDEKPLSTIAQISNSNEDQDTVEKKDFNDNEKKEINFDDYYAVGYNTNSEQQLLDELIKKL